ncbi:unnamed protein product [Amoebophrya sp. A120]|nr:unnamed protein product [Amoebophrya sp. A120]|eukprot:GSA120T00012986001.1
MKLHLQSDTGLICGPETRMETVLASLAPWRSALVHLVKVCFEILLEFLPKYGDGTSTEAQPAGTARSVNGWSAVPAKNGNTDSSSCPPPREPAGVLTTSMVETSGQKARADSTSAVDLTNPALTKNPDHIAYWLSRGHGAMPAPYVVAAERARLAAEKKAASTGASSGANRAAQLNPAHELYWKARGRKGIPSAEEVEAEIRKISEKRKLRGPGGNKGDQLNPQHDTYWETRAARRPSQEDIEELVNQNQADRAVHTQACQVAARTAEEKKAIGRDTDRIVKILQRIVPKCEVRKAGSQSKGTNVRGSDLDLRVTVPEKVSEVGITSAQWEKLVGELESAEFSVEIGKKVLKITNAACDIEIVPNRAEHIPDGVGWKQRLVNPNQFKNNPKAQAAVRVLKDEGAGEKFRMKSYEIEKHVIRLQQANPKASSAELVRLFYEGSGSSAASAASLSASASG